MSQPSDPDISQASLLSLSLSSLSLEDPEANEELLNKSLPLVSVVMSRGTVVCDEVKLSALVKLARITEEHQKQEIQAEAALKAEIQPLHARQCSTEAGKKTPVGGSPQSSEDVDADSIHRLKLCLLEQQRQAKVNAAMEARAAKLRSHSEHIANILAQRAKQRELERQEQVDAMWKELRDVETLEKNRTALVLQLQTKKHQEQAKKIDRLVEEAGRLEQLKQDEHRQKRELLEKIIVKQQRFRDVFTQISDTLRSFPYREEMVASLPSTISAIKSLSEMMDTLVKQFKVGEVSQLDLTTAESLVEKLESGQTTVNAKLDEIRRQKDEEKSAEVAAPEPSEPSLPTPGAALPPQQFSSSEQKPKLHVTGLEGFILSHNLEELTSLQQLLDEQLASLKPLEDDVKLKKFRFQCQMAVNTPLNAISAVNAAHMKDKLRRLQSLLRGQPVEVSGSRVAASTHQLGIAFCTNLLAERVVAQGEQTVSSKPESAYPIAAVALALWAEFPQFGQLLLAHFFTQCPYLVPYYVPRTSGMTDKQYYSAQGYRYSAEGQVESRDKFLKRMTGTATLYFAILSARLPRDLGLSPPPTLTRVWSWLASLLNLTPRPDVSATVLLACLEVAGSALASIYPRQFNKLFLATARHYYPLLKEVSPSDMSGPISRLEIFLNSAVKNSSLSPPAGALPANFW